MIVILKPDVPSDGPEVREVLALAARYKSVSAKVHTVQGRTHGLVEIYLLGDTKTVDAEDFAAHPAVLRVVRISEKYRVIGRHQGQVEALGFEYNGVHFGAESFHVFPGLC